MESRDQDDLTMAGIERSILLVVLELHNVELELNDRSWVEELLRAEGKERARELDAIRAPYIWDLAVEPIDQIYRKKLLERRRRAESWDEEPLEFD